MDSLVVDSLVVHSLVMDSLVVDSLVVHYFGAWRTEDVFYVFTFNVGHKFFFFFCERSKVKCDTSLHFPSFNSNVYYYATWRVYHNCNSIQNFLYGSDVKHYHYSRTVLFLNQIDFQKFCDFFDGYRDRINYTRNR